MEPKDPRDALDRLAELRAREIPPAILEQLARVRSREVSVRAAWGAGRWLGLAIAAMLVSCLLDWLIDLRTDTPGVLRVLLLLAQIGLWAGAGWALIVRPFLEHREDRDVALWVEENFPELGHRVISAVQLNDAGAETTGMSPELIIAMTGQAVEMSAARTFADRVQLNRWSGRDGALAAAALLALVLALAGPSTAGALVARQFMADRDIPRSVEVAAEKADRVWPTGEEVVLRFKVTSKEVLESWTGDVRIDPEGRSSETYPLVVDRGTAQGEAVFKATIPPFSVNFAYNAWLRDGRTRKPAALSYEPRPVVKKIEAWTILPAYVGLRPDGAPYEQPRLRGEIAGPKGSSARVVCEIQKPVLKGQLELLTKGPEQGQDVVLRRLDLAPRKEGREVEAVFDLRTEETSYRIVVEDRHGFGNSSPPRRGISIVPDEPPRVVLLPERFAMPGEELIGEDAEVEGAPIPLGSTIPIAYYCAHPYGLKDARLSWRIIKSGQQAGEAPPAASEGDWKRLPLGEVRGTEESGPFDLRRGLFTNSGFRDQVEFHPLASPDLQRVPGRLEGGGCFFFQTKALAGVQVGDQVEFFVEVFARNPDLARQPGRSEARLKAFVTEPQFVDWILQTLRHESRVRQLESRQKGVFAPEGADR